MANEEIGACLAEAQQELEWNKPRASEDGARQRSAVKVAGAGDGEGEPDGKGAEGGEKVE